MSKRPYSIFTQVVRGGMQEPEGNGLVPAVTPIIASVGYVHPTMDDTDHALGSQGGSVANPQDYVYARNGAPTQAAFESAMADLEGAEASLSFSSGMAALHAAMLAVVTPGGSIVAAQQLYGTTLSLLNWVGANLDVKVRFVDFLDLAAVRRAISEDRPHLVVCEVLTNPLARVIRLDVVIDSAREVGAKVLVDNTFASPYLIRPLAMGVDLVAHSTTKFINGHGDVLGGVVSGSQALIEQVRTHRRVLGGMPGPFDAWLALRGMRTLAIRMQQSCQNAMRLASWLNEQKQVSRVYYPGLPSDPCHHDASAMFRSGSYGAMLAFDLDDYDRRQTFAAVERLQVIRPVTSLGDVNTWVSHPATASHRGLSPEAREALGIYEGTLRLSVGIEDPDDLIADLTQAL